MQEPRETLTTYYQNTRLSRLVNLAAQLTTREDFGKVKKVVTVVGGVGLQAKARAPCIAFVHPTHPDHQRSFGNLSPRVDVLDGLFCCLAKRLEPF